MGSINRSLRGQNQRDDESVQSQCLSEDQNQDHPHEDFILLRVGPHTCVSYDANRQSGRLRLLMLTSELNPQHSPEARWA